MMSFERLCKYTKLYAARDDGTEMSSDEAGTSLVEMARAYKHQHPGLTFPQALDAVLNSRDGEVALNTYNRGTRSPGDEDDGLVDPAELACDRARSLMGQDPSMDFTQAVAAALNADPRLKQAYANYASGGGS